MSADYVILFLQLLPIRVSFMLRMFLEKISSVFRSFTLYTFRDEKKEDISSKKSWNGYFRLLPLVLIRVYEFRLPRGLLLTECIWTFIQMIQNENVLCRHLIIQLGAGASLPKESRQTTAFQRRFETLK
jgi:hypothetical protein